MNSKIFRQASAPWGSLPYYSARNVKQAGCGLCSVTHCLIEQSKYKESTPSDFHSFMRKYSVDGGGTYYNGITAGLEHFGMEDVRRHDSIFDLFPLLDKEKRVGVLLFNSNRGPDGTIWTTSGHYIAFTDYKKINGKHYLYLKDSGTRKHDGWYIYENSIKGCLKVAVWSCRVPEEKKPDPEPPKEVKKEDDEMLSYEEFKNYQKRYEAEKKNEPASEYSQEAIEWAKKNGILKGDNNGRVMPRSNISREDVAVMLHRYDTMNEDDI